jgi:pyruvate,orthophosphate dikinase
VQRCRHLLDDGPLTATALPDEVVAEHLVATGMPASPGRGVGVLTVAVEDALRRHDAGDEVVLVRPTTSPADVAGMAVAAGVVTVTGGLMSHAALVARSWAVPAVVGAHGLVVDDAGVRTADRRLAVGDVVTVDGSTGLLLAGAHPGAAAAPPELAVLRRWAAARAAVPSIASRSVVPSDDGHGDRVSELEVLRLVVLRSRTDVDAIAFALGSTRPAVASSVADLIDADLLFTQGSSLAATAAGRDRIAADVAEVVARHGPRFAGLLDRFQRPDRELKQIVTAYQLGPDGPDGAAIRRIHEMITGEATAIISAAAAVVPRLERYGARLDAALAQLASGDARYLAHPAVDSIHTIWFELHEELIRLAGTDRATETAAGRA